MLSSPELRCLLDQQYEASLDLAAAGLTRLQEEAGFRFASPVRPLGDEPTVFAVDASARGLGAGSALFRDYMAHLRAHDRTGFHLYTDSLCTYQFYERKGMVRAAEEDMALRVEGLPGAVEVYLYTGRVPEQALSRLSSSAAG